MIDSIAMVLCVLGYAALSFGFRRFGFAVSLAGSCFWFMFALAVGSNPLLLQSIAFSVFSCVGLVGRKDS